MWYRPLKAFNVNCNPFFGAEMSDTKWNVVLLGGSVLKSNRNLILRARIYLAKLYTQLKPNVIKWIRSDKKGDSMLIGTSFSRSTLGNKKSLKTSISISLFCNFDDFSIDWINKFFCVNHSNSNKFHRGRQTFTLKIFSYVEDHDGQFWKCTVRCFLK